MIKSLKLRNNKDKVNMTHLNNQKIRNQMIQRTHLKIQTTKNMRNNKAEKRNQNTNPKKFPKLKMKTFLKQRRKRKNINLILKSSLRKN